MKRYIFLGALCSVGLLVASGVSTAHAQETMTDSHIRRIKQNCSEALRVIQRQHANDGPLRVNRGQAYDSLSTKLMTPLNSRLTINRLDASSLVKTTAQYDKVLNDFRSNYKKYDDQMSKVLTIDCKKQPVTFYDEVTKAREYRSAVYDNVQQLHGLIDNYRTSFDRFRTDFKDGKAKGES